MGRAYLVIIILMALLSSMCHAVGSRSRSFNGPQPYNTESASSRSGGESFESGTGEGGEVVLERSSNGHFYANVEINGAEVTMLVDTGASGIALSRSDAEKAGLPMSSDMPEVIGQGASGEVRGEVVTLERVSFGGQTAEDMRAVVLEGGEMSLLGQDFLREFESVQIEGDRMVLR